MANKATIDHPGPGRVNTGGYASFAAFGSTGATPRAVRCYLLDPNGARVNEGRLLPVPPGSMFWAAAFSKVPLGQSFGLELVDATVGTRLANVAGLDLQSSPSSTSISYPIPGDSVLPSFTAYGSTNRTISGGRMVNGSASFDGGLTQDQNSWYLTFANVNPFGAGWTLNVNDDVSSPAASSDDLTVGTTGGG